MKECATCGHETNDVPNYCPDCGNEWETRTADYPVKLTIDLGRRDSISNKSAIDHSFPEFDPYNYPDEVPRSLSNIATDELLAEVTVFDDYSWVFSSFNGNVISHSD